MTEEQINEIQNLFYSGMTKAEIARKMGCPIGKGHFSLDVFQAICNVVGKTFEDTFILR